MLRGFETTSWSMVLGAKDEDSQGPREALDQLCRTYWPPIYSFFRSNNYSEEDAQDLTQEFFCLMMKRHFLQGVEPGLGRFRTFLLAAAENLLKDEYRKSHAAKRVGTLPPIAMDVSRAESLYAWDANRTNDPRRVFDQQWAQTLLDMVLQRLEDEFSASGRSDVFEVLKGNLVPRGLESPHKELGQRLGMSVGAVKVTVHRMRKRYGALLREEVEKTVEDPAQVEDELRYLFEALGD